MGENPIIYLVNMLKKLFVLVFLHLKLFFVILVE